MATVHYHQLGQGGGQMMYLASTSAAEHLASGPADGGSSIWNPRNDWLMQYTPSTTFDRFCQALFAFTYINNRQERERCQEEHKKMCRAIVEYNKQQGRTADALRLAYLMRRIHSPWHKRFVSGCNCLCANRDDQDGCVRCSGHFDMTLELGFGRNRLVAKSPTEPESARCVLQQIGTEIKNFNSHYRASSWLMRADSCAEPLPYEPWTAQFTADDMASEDVGSVEATTAVQNDDSGNPVPTFPAYVFLPLPSPSKSTEHEPVKKKLKGEPASPVKVSSKHASPSGNNIRTNIPAAPTPPFSYANMARVGKTDSARPVP